MIPPPHASWRTRPRAAEVRGSPDPTLWPGPEAPALLGHPLWEPVPVAVGTQGGRGQVRAGSGGVPSHARPLRAHQVGASLTRCPGLLPVRWRAAAGRPGRREHPVLGPTQDASGHTGLPVTFGRGGSRLREAG